MSADWGVRQVGRGASWVCDKLGVRQVGIGTRWMGVKLGFGQVGFSTSWIYVCVKLSLRQVGFARSWGCEKLGLREVVCGAGWVGVKLGSGSVGCGAGWVRGELGRLLHSPTRRESNCDLQKKITNGRNPPLGEGKRVRRPSTHTTPSRKT